MTSTANPHESRIGFLDFLRGFALLGILAVNMPFLAHPIYATPPDFTWLDQASSWFVSFAGEAKFFVLFSFLFGYGFSMQLRRAEERGEPLGPRYARRLVGILAFGVIHAVLLFMGDILVAYALLGGLLWFLRNQPIRGLLKTTAVALGISVFAYGLLAVLIEWDASVTSAAEAAASIDQAHQAYLGPFLDGARQRMEDLLAAFPVLVLFNWPSAFAMFALGLAAGKARVLDRTDELWPRLLKALPWALLIGVTWNALYASLSQTPDPGLLGLVVFMGLALSAPLLSLSYTTGLLGLWRSGRLRWIVEPISSAGRLSLTNYMGQSVIAGFLFNGYGLGWYGTLGSAKLLALGVSIFAAQCILSHIWLRFFRFGPEEWLLRCWTYGRLQPILSHG